MVATSSNAWASSIPTLRTPTVTGKGRESWGVFRMDLMGFAACCFNGDSMFGTFVKKPFIYKVVFFFSRLKKTYQWPHPPKFAHQQFFDRDWTFDPSVCRFVQEWDPLENSGHKGSQGLWPMAWPEAWFAPGSWTQRIGTLKFFGKATRIRDVFQGSFCQGRLGLNFREGYFLFSPFFLGEMIQFD